MNIPNLEPEYTTAPSLSFEGKCFCFIGVFDDYPRSDLERTVVDRGATYSPNVSEETDFLVIGSKALRCCSFSCCVRVAEQAVALRKNGAALQLIRESDFLDALDV